MNLKALSLNFNSLTGSIPSIIGSLSSLSVIYLGSNKLVGTIPTSLGKILLGMIRFLIYSVVIHNSNNPLIMFKIFTLIET